MSKLTQAAQAATPARRQPGEGSTRTTRTVRVTVDLEHDLHRQLKLAAVEADITLQAILHALAKAYATGNPEARRIVHPDDAP